jgi:hypothetical protein
MLVILKNKNHKKITFSFILLMNMSLMAQNIIIPDFNLQNALLTNASSGHAYDSNGIPITLDAYSDDEIQISTELSVYNLAIYCLNNKDGIGLESFTNLKE